LVELIRPSTLRASFFAAHIDILLFNSRNLQKNGESVFGFKDVGILDVVARRYCLLLLGYEFLFSFAPRSCDARELAISPPYATAIVFGLSRSERGR
jgi:hypothetical protein